MGYIKGNFPVVDVAWFCSSAIFLEVLDILDHLELLDT